MSKVKFCNFKFKKASFRKYFVLIIKSIAHQKQLTMAAFLKSFPERSRGLSRSRREPFRKGVEKNDSDTEKRSPRPQCYRCLRNLSRSTAKAAATVYTHINVAIVTRSHFGNAKPKFHMNCWPTISINDWRCQQRCITGPTNILTCTYSFIFTIYKCTGKQQRNAYLYPLRTVKHRTKLIIPQIMYIFLCEHSYDVSERARKSNVNNIWLADATHASRRTTFPRQ